MLVPGRDVLTLWSYPSVHAPPNPIPTHHPHPHPLPPQPHTHPTPTPHPPYPHPTPQPNFYFLRIVQCIFNYVYQNWLRQFRWHFSHFSLVANGICYCLRLLYSRPIMCHETRIIYTDNGACFTGGHYWVTFLMPFLSFESPNSFAYRAPIISLTVVRTSSQLQRLAYMT